MKKTYLIPSTEVLGVQTQLMIATSLLNVAKEGDTANLKSTSATEDADAMVKGNYNVWEDDWSN